MNALLPVFLVLVLFGGEKTKSVTELLSRIDFASFRPVFNLLGVISWQLRTLRLPAEVFAHCGETYHISVGDVITPDEQKKFADVKEFGAMLRQRTYALRERK